MPFSSEYLSNDYIHLNSCGVQQLDKDIGSLRIKGRVDYHILYIYSGRCFAQKHNEELVVEEGNIIVYMPKEKQHYRFIGKDNSVSCYLHFTGTGCAELINSLHLSKNGTLYVGKSGTLKSIVEKMALEHSLKRTGYEGLCNAYLLEFFAMATRKADYNGNPDISKNIRKIDDVRLQMYDHYADALPLQYYADYCNLSLSRFAHLFTDIVGISPVAYITKIKIEKSINLLNATDMSISEIAEKSGFSDQNYFGTTFKKITGMSPSAYRKKNN